MTLSASAARGSAKKLVNGALRPLGVRLASAEVVEDDTTLRQLVDAYQHLILPGLNDRDGRFDLLKNLQGTPVPEAMHLLKWLQDASEGPGDVCEMGVAQGYTSALIANEIRDSDRRFWIYDSFEGLSRPTDEDVLIDDIFELGSIDRYTNTMAFPADLVRARIRSVGFPDARTRIVPGYIRADLGDDHLPTQVAFAYIDFDLYEPILIGLELMHPRTRAGSVLMVDDYKYFSSGVEQAVVEFMAAHPGEYDLMESPAAAGCFCALRRL